MNKIDRLKEMINESKNIVFFTGAGVSTESGIKDFRSKDGLYNEKNNYKYPPEFMLSRTCFYTDIQEFYKFYIDKMDTLKCEPNITHKFIKELEKEKNVIVVTQNIDGLHTRAGSKIVYELHGTINKNYCIKCNKKYDAKYVFSSKKVPKCSCGGIIKPKVVLYEEALPEKEFIKSEEAIKNADILIVMGTSLTVHPASGLVNLFKGKYFVIINKEETLYDDKANLVIHDKLSNIIKKLYESLDLL